MKEDMIIECKNCNTKFKVNTSDIEKNGRMVSCSVCGYEWLYIPKKTDSIEKLIFHDKLKEQTSETKQKTKEKSITFLMTVVNLLLITVFLAAFLYTERDFLIKQHDAIEAFYRLFDYHNVDGLELKVMKLEKVQYTENKDNKKAQYEIPLKIINNTDKTKFLQVIKIIGYDIDCNKSINLSANIRKRIPARSELNVSLRTEEIVEKIDFMIAKMGNADDLRDFDFDVKLCVMKE